MTEANFWTEQEDFVIVEHASSLDRAVKALRAIGSLRTRKAIARRRQRLVDIGTLPKAPVKGAWSRAEDDALRALYPTTNTPEIAKALLSALGTTRSPKQIQARARTIGLSKSPEWIEAERIARGQRMRELNKVRASMWQEDRAQQDRQKIPTWPDGIRFEDDSRAIRPEPKFALPRPVTWISRGAAS